MSKTSTLQDNLATKLLEARGYMVNTMTSDDWLQVALDCEQTARDCGPFDPAYEHFINQAQNAFRAAEIQENGGQ